MVGASNQSVPEMAIDNRGWHQSAVLFAGTGLSIPPCNYNFNCYTNGSSEQNLAAAMVRGPFPAEQCGKLNNNLSPILP